MTVRRSAIRVVFGLALLLPLGTGQPAQAADPPPASASAQPTPTPGGGDIQVPGQEPTEGDTVVALLVLAFGMVALGLLYLYLNGWRKDTASLTRAYLRVTGALPVYELVRETVQRPGAFETAGAAELKIKGPQVVTVGQPSQPFTALLDDAEVKATWSVDPPNATVDPTAGASSRIIPTAAGPLTVRAAVEGGEAKASVAVVDAPRSPGGMPLVGQGYGGLWVAIVGVTVAGALTGAGVLPGAALATLLGTVVSYFFVQRREGRADEGKEGAAEGKGGDG